MRRFPLLVLLLVLLLAVTGCTSTAPAAQPDDILTNHSGLDLSVLSQETLAAALQTIDQTASDQGVEVRVSQTLGDAMTLYVTYTAAFPPGTHLEELLPGPVTLSADGKALPYSSQGNSAEPMDDATLACTSSFGFDKEVLQPGQAVTLTIDGFQQEGEPVFDTTHTFTWTVENEGAVKYLDVKNEAGKMVGTCNFSAFAMHATLWDWQDHYDDSTAYLSTLQLLDEGGQPIQTTPSGGGSGANIWKQFRIPVDLDAVAAVQVGPYRTQCS